MCGVDCMGAASGTTTFVCAVPIQTRPTYTNTLTSTLSGPISSSHGMGTKISLHFVNHVCF